MWTKCREIWWECQGEMEIIRSEKIVEKLDFSGKNCYYFRLDDSVASVVLTCS